MEDACRTVAAPSAHCCIGRAQSQVSVANNPLTKHLSIEGQYDLSNVILTAAVPSEAASQHIRPHCQRPAFLSTTVVIGPPFNKTYKHKTP